MAIAFTDKAVQLLLDTGYDNIFDGGTLELRSGAPPGPGAAPTGTLIWSIATGANMMAATVGRTKALTAVLSAAAVAGAVVGHYRLKAAGDTGAATQTQAREEGTVTATGGGGDMTIDNTNVANGQVVTVTAKTIAL
jgi:hypothetical protein